MLTDQPICEKEYIMTNEPDTSIQIHSLLDKLMEKSPDNYDLVSKIRMLIGESDTSTRVTQFQIVSMQNGSLYTLQTYVLRADGTLWYTTLNSTFKSKWTRVETPKE